MPDDNGGLWVGTDEGVAYWDGVKLTANRVWNPGRVQVLSMARDRDGNIWARTDSRGLLRLNEQGAVPLDSDSAGWGNAVTAVFEDREGSVWTAGANGIERLRDSPFVTYSAPEGVPSDGPKPLFLD